MLSIMKFKFVHINFIFHNDYDHLAHQLCIKTLTSLIFIKHIYARSIVQFDIYQANQPFLHSWLMNP